MNTDIDACLGRHVFELETAHIVEQRHSLNPVVGQKEVHFPVIVIIEEASACAQNARCIRSRPGGQSGFLRYIHEPHLDLSRRFQDSLRRLHGTRIFPLLAVGKTHRRADLVLRDVLKLL